MIEAILFDCDGTLVDSEPLFNEVLSKYLAELGFRLSPEEALLLFRGTRFDDCVAQLNTMFDRGLPANFVAECRGRSHEAFRQRLQPIEGAVELLDSLAIDKCVASNGPREKIVTALSTTGLLPYFEDRIFSAYEVGAWKPQPGLFLCAAEAMRILPRHCLVVEDSMPGVKAGLAAGMQVVALGVEPTPELEAAGVNFISRLSQLLPFVHKL